MNIYYHLKKKKKTCPNHIAISVIERSRARIAGINWGLGWFLDSTEPISHLSFLAVELLIKLRLHRASQPRACLSIIKKKKNKLYIYIINVQLCPDPKRLNQWICGHNYISYLHRRLDFF